MGVGVLYPVAATAASTFSDKPRCENDINPRIGPPAMGEIELEVGAGRPNLPQLRRNIRSNGRKSTCNGLPQRSKLNGLLHFFMTPGRRAPMPEASPENLPTVLVAGLNCSARLYADQITALWQFGPVTVADHRRDDSMAAMAQRVLAAAPPRFALVGLSMGGYVAFEIMRQAASRVAKLALLDTRARGEAPAQTEQRKPLIALAKSGRFAEILESQYPTLVHRSRARHD